MKFLYVKIGSIMFFFKKTKIDSILGSMIDTLFDIKFNFTILKIINNTAL